MMFLLLLVMLTACAAIPQDLSGKMFTFPQQSATALVNLTASGERFGAVTVCHRSFTDLKRTHGLFSLATRSIANDFMIAWDNVNKELQPHIRNARVEYGGWDYKPNMWHSICTTWDSESGLVQMWFDGQPSIRKFIISGSAITGSKMIVLGQEQDTYGGGYDVKQSFVGMMTDVHMWDHTLSACEIHKYVDELNFTPGNVLNWGALEFAISGKVVVEDKLNACY
ncbi:serum amyloid P-component-like [Pungitius pungitius]|uniref:serum amyloid P-component-like n=1 Tax=Pungitius pungitius TaxID=134920 RepID=UPI002E126B05